MGILDKRSELEPEDKQDTFEEWLGGTVKRYRNLTEEQRNVTLNTLINRSTGWQLYYLSQNLLKIIYRDFFAQLPIEITYRILEYLDTESLVSCCEVTAEWNKIVSSCQPVWRRACLEVGVKPHDSDPHDDDCSDYDDDSASENLLGWNQSEDVDYRKLYETQIARLKKMKTGSTFEMRFLDGHTGAITALYYYKDNKVATGSDDHSVRIWDIKARVCLLEVKTDHTVSAVKFDDTTMLIGSFFGTIVRWDLETREFVCDYVGHVNAVPSLDYDTDLDVLVTASYDTTIKLWSLSNSTLIRSITQEIAPFPIFRPLVKLIKNRGPFGGDCYYTVLACYSGRGGMNSSVDLRCSIYRLTIEHTIIKVMDHGDTEVGMPRYDLPYMVDILRYNLYHGLKKLDDSLPLLDKLHTMPLMPHEVDVLKTTATYGSCYGLVLHTAKGEIVIYDRKTLNIISQITLPNCSVRGHGLAILCQKDWLNGMNEKNCSGLFFLIARNCQLLLLKWKSPPTPRAPRTSISEPAAAAVP
ncbi:uncharacterized protein LOC141905371 [Tubulanus polymorphus]|uniref:uncharacterized protein LOC141905371 n=1 Tax=Tubulanus polymorphus TaxID=672921 RepID=UPI003DA68CC5